MDSIKSILNADEIILPSSPAYAKETLVWSAHKHQRPQLVARPASVESLSRLLIALNDTDLEFAIRCGGCGNSSSKDVVITLSAFAGFKFISASETVIIGAGQVWEEVDRKLEEAAPGYASVLLPHA